MIYNDYVSFMKAVVLPRKSARPDDIRLDGHRTGGSREVVGKFKHADKVWKVHADTHYEPLYLALTAASKGEDPFIEEATKRGRCLSLSSGLRTAQTTSFKHLYIYEI